MDGDSETDERGIDRRTVLRSAAAASAAGVLGVPAFAGSVGGATETTTEIPLTWERSAETSDGVAKSNVLEGAVSDGLSLSTSPDGSVTGTSGGDVWNGGQYYQGNDKQYLDDVDFDFATWDQWDAGCASGDSSPYDGSDNDGEPYQVRLFEANFDLPDGVSPENVTNVSLTSPVELSDEGDIVPINDNFYVALNDSDVLQKGGTADPSFGLSDFGPASRNQDYETNPGLVVSDGWYFSGDLGTGVQDYLEAEDNTLYLAVEEFCNWGGTTRLDLNVTYETCTECTTDGLLAKYEFSCVEYDDDECVEYDFVLEEGDESLVSYSPDSYTSKDGEEFEPVTATFETGFCTVYAVVKAGPEIEVQEADASSGTVTVENVDPYAISFVEFYCDKGDADAAAESFPGGESGGGPSDSGSPGR